MTHLSTSLLGQLLKVGPATPQPVERRGRPINAASRRQRILAWLEHQPEAQHTKAIDAACGPGCAATLCELAREGQIVRKGSIVIDHRRHVVWGSAE